MATKTQQERILRGQCPNCGEEAAPYYLCHKCRFRGKIVRVLNRGRNVGGFVAKRDGRSLLWSLGDESKLDTIKYRPDAKDGDKRLEPRLRGIRVDVESTLIEVIRYAKRPCTLEEILSAWGRLRSRRESPLAADLACIIAAEDKRKRKAERNKTNA